MSDFQIEVGEVLKKYWKESIECYELQIDFVDETKDWETEDALVGVLLIRFDVQEKELVDGHNWIINTSYEIPFFVDPNTENEDEYLEDDQAFVYIFSNYGEEIRELVELASFVLYEHYENGTPIFEDEGIKG